MFPMEKTPLEEGENGMDDGNDGDDDDEGEVEMEEVVSEERKVQKLKIRVVCGQHHGSRKASSSSSCSSSWLCCCRADECGLDLRMAKKYNQRHKVCERHSKAPVVLVSSIRQRFCQQCSKFHELAQFDDTKRSCRERLADHNKRRRKAHAVAGLHSRSERQPASHLE